MKRIAVNALGCGVLLGLCTPFVARATFMNGKFEGETYLNPGFLLGAVFREGHIEGALGVEVSVHHFTQEGLGVGGFGQWQHLSSSFRLCGGVQVSFAEKAQGFGVEMGAAHEAGDVRFAGTTSVHFAPFVSIGLVTMSFRVGIPFHSSDPSLPGRGVEGGMNLALKLPMLVGKSEPRLRPNRTSPTTSSVPLP